MNISLTNHVPSTDGYHLMKFNKEAGVHLVLLQTEIDGTRVLIPDSVKMSPIKINSSHEKVFETALFSEVLVIK